MKKATIIVPVVLVCILSIIIIRDLKISDLVIIGLLGSCIVILVQRSKKLELRIRTLELKTHNRKQTQKALKNNETNVRRIIESIPDVLLLKKNGWI